MNPSQSDPYSSNGYDEPIDNFTDVNGSHYEDEEDQSVSDISSSSISEDEDLASGNEMEDDMDLDILSGNGTENTITGSNLLSNRTHISAEKSGAIETGAKFLLRSSSRTAIGNTSIHEKNKKSFRDFYEETMNDRRNGNIRIPSPNSSGYNRDNSSSRRQKRESLVSRGSRQSSRGTDNTPPVYYEYTGGWLRLRPQNEGSESSRQYMSNNLSNSHYPPLNSSIHNRGSSQYTPYYSQLRNRQSASFINFDIEEGQEEGKSTADDNDRRSSIPSAVTSEGKASADKTETRPVTADTAPTLETTNDHHTSDDNHVAQEHEIQEDQNEKEEDDVAGNIVTLHGAEIPPPSSPQRSLNNEASRHSSIIDTQWASTDSKYERYACRVDQNQGDKSVEIPLFLFQRPHMRAFHFAWMSFFTAFFAWFAIAPLLPEIRDTLDLSHGEIWLSNVFSSAGTVICRIIIGPLNDRFGARWMMASTLIIASIPVMMTGLVHNAVELYILRLVTGIAGSSFVTCQYWTSSMFTREIAGTANSLAAGWGNLGGGITQIVMGSALFPLFKLMYGGSSNDIEKEKTAAQSAWRTVCVVPAISSFLMAYVILKYSDDCPKGNYRKLKRLGLMPRLEAKTALNGAASDYNTWLMAIHYGCCFGAEVTFTAGAALYFNERFHQRTEVAAALASIFGWMNLFARGLGGFVSDILNVKHGMRGRLCWQFITIALEGIFLVAFGHATTLGASVGLLVLLSLFVQLAEVSPYLITPCQPTSPLT